jgi:hypothetical protein
MRHEFSVHTIHSISILVNPICTILQTRHKTRVQLSTNSSIAIVLHASRRMESKTGEREVGVPGAGSRERVNVAATTSMHIDAH